MAHRVVWSQRALADLEAIASYIELDSFAYANAVVRRIVSLTRTLEDFHLRVEKCPSLTRIPRGN